MIIGADWRIGLSSSFLAIFTTAVNKMRMDR